MSFVYIALTRMHALAACGTHEDARAYLVNGHGWLVVSPIRILSSGLTLCQVEA
jgi:hypothetical protein